MIDLIEALMRGDTVYPRAFAAALPFWQRFYKEHEGASDADLQRAIEEAQIAFQWAVEEVGMLAPHAKSIMAVTAIGTLYNDGFEDEALARRVIAAFLGSSSLSTGVIGAAREVAHLYRLD